MVEEFDNDFIAMAFTLGYYLEDLQPIPLKKLETESAKILKKMNEKQRKFYLMKKLQSLETRRQNIIQEVQIAISNKLYKDKKYPNNNDKNPFNPIVIKMLQEHEKKCKNKQKNIQRKIKNNQFKSFKNNTIDMGRTSPVLSNYSSISKHSSQSAYSKRSLNSKQSSQSKLDEIKKKHRQILHFKRAQMEQKLKRSMKRINFFQSKAQINSNNLKTHSQAQKKIVKQNIKQLQNIKDEQIRNHLKKMKYNMQRIQQLKDKNKIRKKSQSFINKNDRFNIEQQIILNSKLRYEQKLKMAEIRRKQNQKKRRETINIFNVIHQQRQNKVKHHKQFCKIQQEIMKKQTQYHQKLNLNNAQKRRNDQIQNRKLKYLENKIKQEINIKNKKCIIKKKQLQIENQMKKNIIKEKQIQEISILKKKLIKQRIRYQNIVSKQNNRHQSLILNLNQ